MTPGSGQEQVNFGEVLRYYRKQEKFSQEQLAEGICTREYIVQIEKGSSIPTLYMIHAFSRKMGINLFDAYAVIVEHNDLDTHRKIEKLNEAISLRDDARIYKLAMEYSDLPGFSYGVPRQCIMHAFSLYYSNTLHDYERSVRYASEGLAISGIDNLDHTNPATITKLDMCLLLVKAVDLCRLGRKKAGRRHLEYLYDNVKCRILESRYIANRNRRFDINMFAVTVYNLCEFFSDEADENMDCLEEAIQILRKYNCDTMREELMLYLAKYLDDKGKTGEARILYRSAYNSLLYFTTQEETDQRASEILGDRLESFSRE